MQAAVFLCIQLLLHSHSLYSKESWYEKIVIFGDSNSDNGNVFRMTNRTYPSSPFYEGRYSNGPVWAEKLKVSSIEIYAFGGATTDSNLTQGITIGSLQVPGVRQQILNYSQMVEWNSINFEKTLYVIWAGGNNFLQNPSTTVASITNSIGEATKDIILLGAKHVVLFNQPPMNVVPALQPFNNIFNLTELGNEYNRNLSAVARYINQSSNSVDLQVFDVYAVISDILKNSTAYGILNTNSSCLGVGCSDPNTYMFFDGVHFTEPIHSQIAKSFNEFIKSASHNIKHTFIVIFLCLIVCFS